MKVHYDSGGGSKTAYEHVSALVLGFWFTDRRNGKSFPDRLY